MTRPKQVQGSQNLAIQPFHQSRFSPPVRRLCTARQRKLSRPHKAHCVSRTRKLSWRCSAQRGPKRSRALPLQSVVCRLISHCSIHALTLFFLMLQNTAFKKQTKNFFTYLDNKNKRKKMSCVHVKEKKNNLPSFGKLFSTVR